MGGTDRRVRGVGWLVSALALLVPSALPAQELDCSVGALDRTIGGGPWRVHACSDGRSLAIVALAENPAAPFYFFFQSKGRTYELVGEGTGDSAWTKPAFDELSAMDTEAISALNVAVRKTVAEPATQP